MQPNRSALSRRQVLQGAAAAGLGLAAVPVLGSRATARTTVTERAAGPTAAQALGMTGTIKDVQHVVFLMLENRSFDHLFGTLSGVRGFDDRSVRDGATFAQYDATTKRHELPFLLSQTNNGQNTPSLSHDWGPQHKALNGGRNDNWLGAHRAADGAQGIFTMGYYTRAEVPYHYALADAFTVCDNYFCSILGPTYPNRLMWQMGSIDPKGLGGGPLLTTDENVFTDNSGQGVFSYETYPERLTKAGVSWKSYTDPASNHLLNMFGAFTQYNVPGSSLMLDGVVGGSTADFLADANAGTLPEVSWIFPAATSTEHPDDGTPNMGPTFYHPVITALMASPSWSSTVLFVTYDENDGYFDHVPPPTAPKGTDLEFLTHKAFTDTAGSDPSDGISGPVGLGFRVPTIVVSPWARGGFVNSEQLDHTSGLRFVETRWGVSLEGIVSDWRRSVTGDMTSTMDFTKPDLSMPDTLAPAFALSQTMLTSTGTETVPQTAEMPVQEKGTRPRRGPVPSFAPAAATTPQAPAAPAAPAVPATGQRESVTVSSAAPSKELAFTGMPDLAIPAAVLAAGGAAALAVSRSRSTSDD